MLTLGGAWGATAWADRPDEAAFTTYLDTYLDGGSYHSDDPGAGARDAAWAAEHASEVLHAGYRACDWLGARPAAPDVDPTARHSQGRLTHRYIGGSRDTGYDGNDVGLPGLTLDGRDWVVTAAWNFLCPGLLHAKTAPVTLDED